MTIRTRRNQYRGVNAHLHSYLQAHSGWQGFHNTFIIYLVNEINARLPEGYIVDAEQSLQIREIHPDTGERIRRPEPDLTVFDRSTSQP
ncbi:MAG TPA: hypothetical protein VJZ27_09255, partial [Aggregatilineales bacterium]|nr:hypothetical protein [Aggregatilineales bacterium]